ncbi:MAG: intradiol ring-cleavage dioxygenase [Candidatus Thiodiazotropha sp. (ex Ctena orbiculata)]|nr:intradiol ring-cleavage dioxygenase [Candidatus Thiodiazotropha taylori]MBT2998245.1 intradiol ring-cleavage dioxygenase [Candidatus Thiodiazotropha taylori]MBT3002543.1 intradiol ring-cleavage dioxygenase [Candidatus Thiodiazotropha taylori]MBV2108587.1 intradiol ring-cleavage dioxygenase [Candidatus Thiodiazotropha taylori]MBV2112843.1 intradiol ring-cleavage dioxygenase [Candidatus Thiodiazotropha taylori]
MNRNYNRRELLLNTASLASLSLLPGASIATSLIKTPQQTAGPFYPTRIPLDSDNNLVDVEGRERPAEGQVTHIFGRLLDTSGRPVRNAQIEIWQCDANGFYHHPRDRGGVADPNFQGFGRTLVDSNGGYRFRTIRPVAYPGRTPHIHVRVLGIGFQSFTTQMYVAGEADNENDFILKRVRNQQARDSIIVPLEPAPAIEVDALAGNFDIVLGLSPSI